VYREEVLELIEELLLSDVPNYHLDIDLRTAYDSSLPEVDIQMVLESSKVQSLHHQSRLQDDIIGYGCTSSLLSLQTRRFREYAEMEDQKLVVDTLFQMASGM
jgi:hypothetical protein